MRWLREGEASDNRITMNESENTFSSELRQMGSLDVTKNQLDKKQLSASRRCAHGPAQKRDDRHREVRTDTNTSRKLARDAPAEPRRLQHRRAHARPSRPPRRGLARRHVARTLVRRVRVTVAPPRRCGRWRKRAPHGSLTALRTYPSECPGSNCPRLRARCRRTTDRRAARPHTSGGGTGLAPIRSPVWSPQGKQRARVRPATPGYPPRGVRE